MNTLYLHQQFCNYFVVVFNGCVLLSKTITLMAVCTTSLLVLFDKLEELFVFNSHQSIAWVFVGNIKRALASLPHFLKTYICFGFTFAFLLLLFFIIKQLVDFLNKQPSPFQITFNQTFREQVSPTRIQSAQN